MQPVRTSPERTARATAARVWLLVAIGGVAALATASAPRLAQDPRYHELADARPWLGIPNALDVLSNAGFLVAGALGLLLVASRPALFADRRERAPWLVLFASVTLIAFGSGWYHLDPTNATLVFDRVPIAAAFAALLAALVAERIGPAAGARLLAPAVLAAVASVLYWYATEARGAGDLRPYAFAQLYPMLMIVLLLWLFPARYTRSADWLVALGVYLLSKVAELADVRVYQAGRIVSGHTLKHLLAALAVALLLRMILRREPLPGGEAREA